LLGLPQPALLSALAVENVQIPDAEEMICLMGRGTEACGETVDMDAEHMLRCKRGNARHARHKAVQKALEPAFREAEYDVYPEDSRTLFHAPAGRSIEPGEFLPSLRPDLLAIDNRASSIENKSLCIDFSIVDATCTDMISKGSSSTRLVAAGEKEKEKLRKYGRPVNPRTTDFMPFVLESHGAFGKSAQVVVKRLVTRIVERRRSRGIMTGHAPRVHQAMVANELKQSISVALKRSQASFVLRQAQLLGVRAGRRRLVWQRTSRPE
jgi:hypothetical protein